MGSLTSLSEYCVVDNRRRVCGRLMLVLLFSLLKGRLTLEGNNGITGHLPTEWGKMTDLEALDLYHNEIIGTIPTEFGQMSNLLELELAHNFLQGEIPSELGLLTQLKSLNLQRNAIKGTLPSEFGNMKNLG